MYKMHAILFNTLKKFTIIVIILLLFSCFSNIFLFNTIANSNENKPPVANAGDDISVESGKVVEFSAKGSYDSDGDIVLYEWDFEGDGVYDWNSTKNGKTTHIYNNPRTYKTTLRVTDNNETTDTDTFYVSVFHPEEKEEEDNKIKKNLISFVIMGEFGFAILLILLFLFRKPKY